MPEHSRDPEPKGKAGGESPPAAPTVEFEASPKLEEHLTREHRLRGLTCPACGGDTTAYAGANPHKQGSYECSRCRLRVRPV